MYEVVGGQLPFGFMGELQVSLAQSEEAGDDQQHFAPERSVEVERVGGSVLYEIRGNAREWVVLSHHHGCRPAHASGAGAAGGGGEVRAPSLRVMAWVELMDAQKPAVTEWHLFRHVREQIRDAAQKVPGLNLREMAYYVNDGGTLAKPFDLSWLRRRDQEYIRFEFDGGGRTDVKDVKRSHVLPSADPEAVLKLVPEAVPGAGPSTPAPTAQVGAHTPSVVQKRKFVFFSSCRKLEDDIRTEIDPERESQDLKDSVYYRYGDAVLFEHIPRPQKEHLSLELERIGNQEVSLHFSGHGGARGLCWHGPSRKKNKEILGKQLARLVQVYDAVDKIDCFFLNACCTQSTGLELHKIGVRVVVCWQTTVRDSTAREFARRFYDKVNLSVRAPGQHAKAFEMVCVEMSDVLSNEWPCLLQASSGQEQSGVKMRWNGEVVEAIEPTEEQVEELSAAEQVQEEPVPIEDPAEDAAGEGAGEQESSEWETTEEEPTDDEGAEAEDAS